MTVVEDNECDIGDVGFGDIEDKAVGNQRISR